MLLTNSLWHRLRISVPQKQTKHPMHVGENKWTYTYAFTFTCVYIILLTLIHLKENYYMNDKHYYILISWMRKLKRREIMGS